MPITRSAGFTLVELLVVIAIVGVLLATVSYRFNPVKNETRLQENEVFEQQLQYALDFASFRNQVVAIELDLEGYHFTTYRAQTISASETEEEAEVIIAPERVDNYPSDLLAERQWEGLEDEYLSQQAWESDYLDYVKLTLSDEIEVVFDITERDAQKKQLIKVISSEETPPEERYRIFVFPTREITPFAMTWRPKEGLPITVEFDALGRKILER